MIVVHTRWKSRGGEGVRQENSCRRMLGSKNSRKNPFIERGKVRIKSAHRICINVRNIKRFKRKVEEGKGYHTQPQCGTGFPRKICLGWRSKQGGETYPQMGRGRGRQESLVKINARNARGEGSPSPSVTFRGQWRRRYL